MGGFQLFDISPILEELIPYYKSEGELFPYRTSDNVLHEIFSNIGSPSEVKRILSKSVVYSDHIPNRIIRYVNEVRQQLEESLGDLSFYECRVDSRTNTLTITPKDMHIDVIEFRSWLSFNVDDQEYTKITSLIKQFNEVNGV